MDRLRAPAGSRARSGLNGSAQGDANNHSGAFEDDLLQSLTCEERESILFLEQTIDSLEQDLEDEDLSWESSSSVENPLVYPRLSSVPELSSSLQEQDIIDLVQTDPDPAGHTGVQSYPTPQDFRNMTESPEPHFDLKPKWEAAENFPSTHIPQPLTSFTPDGATDSSSHFLHQPTGFIPTPVIILQKIAACQAGRQSINPTSVLSGRRRSLDSAGSSSSFPSLDHPVKEGPSVSGKPSRYPDNISIHVGNRDFGQTINRASVNVLQRQAQVLANLTGTSHTLESVETRTEQKIPKRSISFRDPAPDKTHMEALSKLGLIRDQPMSSRYSHLRQVNIPSLPTTMASFSNDDSGDNKSSGDLDIYRSKSTSISSTVSLETKEDTKFQHVDSYGKDNTVTPQMHNKCSLGGFRNYGGRTKVITPLSTARSDVPSDNHDSVSSDVLPPLSTRAVHTEVSSYGGQTKTKSPTSISMQETTIPSSIIVSQNSRATETISTPLSTGTEAFLISSSHGENPRATTSDINSNTSRPAVAGLNARSMSFSIDSRASEAPQVTRQSRTSSFHEVPVWPEPRRRSFMKPPAFRPQGITVQFSGRGASDESRREALRKLGLLRDTS